MEISFLINKGGCGVFCLFVGWLWCFKQSGKGNSKEKSNKKGDKTLSSAVHNLYEQFRAEILIRRIKEMENGLFNTAEEKAQQ